MNKEQQIEEMAVIGCVRNPQAHIAEECAKCDFKQGCCNAYRHAEALYNAGYRKTFTSDFASDTQKAYKEGYIKGIEETEADNEALKMWNDAYTEENEKLKIYNDKLCQGIYWGNGENFSISIEKAKQNAVKEFAEKLQKELPCRDYTFNGITFSMILTSSMKYVIDKLLKEYEK